MADLRTHDVDTAWLEAHLEAVGRDFGARRDRAERLHGCRNVFAVDELATTAPLRSEDTGPLAALVDLVPALTPGRTSAGRLMLHCQMGVPVVDRVRAVRDAAAAFGATRVRSVVTRYRALDGAPVRIVVYTTTVEILGVQVAVDAMVCERHDGPEAVSGPHDSHAAVVAENLAAAFRELGMPETRVSQVEVVLEADRRRRGLVR